MRFIVTALLLLWLAPPQTPVAPPTPVPATRLQTRWAAQVNPERVLPEYPRPQLARPKWTNLNGTWSYAITAAAAPKPAAFDGRILVPFPVESQLSGASVWVAPEQRLWYRRTFTAPTRVPGERVLLNFGAVDWEASVYVNGAAVGEHRGGYDPFTFDITAQLRPEGEQELIVAVRDATDEGEQPRGKQVRRPRGIYYTAVTGIWQTVWLETVPESHVTSLRIDPDLERRVVRVSVSAAGAAATNAALTVLDGTRVVRRVEGPLDSPIELPIDSPHPWAPSDPFLYTLRVRVGQDDVQSYFGMRSISVRSDPSGARRLFLNGKPLFQLGLLDQGWWPDGLYTAPTDEALAFDIEKTRELGFNLIRKHVKVEPARWYYHADRLGMLVWQDMPSGNNKGADGEANYARELKAVIDTLRNHPSIVMWVPFNEGWGQHATEKHVSWLKAYDPTRLVNNTSGWTDTGVGDVADLHSYPGPAMPPPEAVRAAALGEFGGLGLPTEGHTWLDRGNWGYRSFTSLADLNAAYQDLLAQLRLHAGDGLAAAIYTQTTDVEIEVNGVMTYDRAVTKLDAASISANRRMYDVPPRIVHVAAASDREAPVWRFTTEQPPANWFDSTFDDAAWQQGPAGFGAAGTRFAHVGTEWKSSDIWLRRRIDIPASLALPQLRVFHDDDAQVYLNGVLAADLPGANSGFAYVALSDAARRALRPGANILAVHAHQTRGGQFIDAGVVDVIGR